MNRNLKRVLIVLMVACLPNASAFSSYLGLRADYLGALTPKGVGGFQFGVDLEPANGPGARLSYTTLAFVFVNRVGLDAYWRFPLEATSLNVYAGAGGSWTFGIVYSNLLEAHGLFGLEIALSSGVDFFVETTLGVILSGQDVRGYYGPPPPPDYRPTDLAGTFSFTLGFGFNFRL